ncbi:hypothetical protein OGATHE_002534 [Ogataea polymorpha]|uniref:Uncharacterized protein n=1 Tax=Ogataea polymorpha TaxID=460523 RepID=A0A9P8PD01_9ASCO|nr:hypothetical protein OGATHE_002534 [Ogataea polymorpha]
MHKGADRKHRKIRRKCQNAKQSGLTFRNQNDPSQSILSQILEPEAKERLSRVRMVRPERVTSVESYLLRLFKSGAIRTKISESEIVEILERVSKEERKGNETKIVFDRRSTHYEDEDEGEEDDFFD